MSTWLVLGHCLDLVMALLWYQLITLGRGGSKAALGVCLMNVAFFGSDVLRDLLVSDRFGEAILDTATLGFWLWAAYQCWRQLKPPKKRRRRLVEVVKRVGHRLVPVPAPASSLS